MSDTGLSLADRAYREIWQRIVHLDYPPSTPLQEKALSQELGMGLSPVRQALRRLEYDGLVMILPRRGTLTTEVGLHSLQWEMEIREELEGFAAALAARRGSRREHEELLEHIATMDELTSHRSDLPTLMRFTDADSAFHRMIYRQTRNDSLIVDLERHFAHALRIWNYCHRSQSLDRPSFTLDAYDMGSYRAIAHAVNERDPGAAREAMRDHVRRDTTAALALLRDLDAR